MVRYHFRPMFPFKDSHSVIGIRSFYIIIGFILHFGNSKSQYLTLKKWQNKSWPINFWKADISTSALTPWHSFPDSVMTLVTGVKHPVHFHLKFIRIWFVLQGYFLISHFAYCLQNLGMSPWYPPPYLLKIHPKKWYFLHAPNLVIPSQVYCTLTFHDQAVFTVFT